MAHLPRCRCDEYDVLEAAALLDVVSLRLGGRHRAPEVSDGAGRLAIMCIRPDTSKATSSPRDVLAAIQRLTPSAYHEVGPLFSRIAAAVVKL